MNGLPGSPTPGGLQGPGRGRGRRARAKVAMSLLQRRLCTLRRALAAAEVQQRKEIIEQKLSPKLRQELIWLMEKMPHDPRSSRSSSASGKAAQRNAANAGRGIASAWRYTDPARIKASLWTVKTCKGDYLSARLHLCGMVLCTRVTRCQREAMRLRQRLEDLGRAAVSSADTAKWDEGSFREAVETAGNLDDLGLYFRLVLDLRPWVGRRVQSPVLALDQLLELRRRLDTEESEGPWPRLRATWLSWMTKTRRKRWRSQVKSQEEAEHLISSAEAQRATCRAASNGTASKATARTAARTARLQRAAQQAEAALARVEQGQQGQQGSKRKR